MGHFLSSTPSGGQSEVLFVLHDQHASTPRRGLSVEKIARQLTGGKSDPSGYGGLNSTSHVSNDLAEDVGEVLATLATLGQVEQAITVAGVAYWRLTRAGILAARKPRPRRRARPGLVPDVG